MSDCVVVDAAGFCLPWLPLNIAGNISSQYIPSEACDQQLGQGHASSTNKKKKAGCPEKIDQLPSSTTSHTRFLKGNDLDSSK